MTRTDPTPSTPLTLRLTADILCESVHGITGRTYEELATLSAGALVRDVRGPFDTGSDAGPSWRFEASTDGGASWYEQRSYSAPQAAEVVPRVEKCRGGDDCTIPECRLCAAREAGVAWAQREADALDGEPSGPWAAPSASFSRDALGLESDEEVAACDEAARFEWDGLVDAAQQRSDMREEREVAS